MGETLDIPTEDPAADPLADALKRIEALERVTNKLAPIHPGFCVPATGSSPAALTGEQEVEPMWLLCNGAVVSQTKWPQLADRYETLGFPYNTGGEAADEMRLPDFTAGRSPVGKSSSGTFVTVGAKAGAETKTLATTEIPSHAHSITDPGHSHSLSGTAVSASTGISVTGNGSVGMPLNNSSDTKSLNATGGTYSAPSTGHTHTITDPNHSHSLSGTAVSASAGITTTQNAGGGSSFSLMNPYQVVPGWLVYAGPPQE